MIPITRVLQCVGILWILSVWFMLQAYWNFPTLPTDPLRFTSRQSSDFLRRRRISTIAIVNLPYRLEKWTRMQQQIKALESFTDTSIPVERQIGVVGSDLNFIHLYADGKLSDQAYRSLIYPRIVGGKFMTPGGLGCFLSHANLWGDQTLEQKRGEAIIVFEDDISFVAGFDPLFQSVLEELPADFGLVYFSDLVNSTKTRSAATPFSKHLDRIHGEHWGTYAYMISYEAARILYQNAFPIQFQVDSYMIDTCKRYNISVYRSTTNLVLTDNSANRVSDVQQRQVERLETMLVPNRFHIFDFLPHADELTSRLEYNKKTHAKHVDRVILRWSQDDVVKRFGSGIDTTRLDSTSPLHLLRLKLTILYEQGGVIIDHEFKSKFPISKALRGVKGFVGYLDASGKAERIAFPLVGFSAQFEQYHQLMECINQHIDDPDGSFTVLEKFQTILSTVNVPNTAILFPVRILTHNF